MEEMYLRNPKNTVNYLSKAHVGIAGCGGLGSNVAIMLARSGVKHLTLVDFDVVEITNLNRQAFRLSQLGMSKCDALKQLIEEINPSIIVELHHVVLDEVNMPNIFNCCNVVCEALDSPISKAIFINSMLVNNKIVVSGNGMAGVHSSNSIVTTRSFKNLYVCGDSSSSLEEGMLATRVMLCSAHMAHTIVRIICERELKYV
ncbi:MAG: sulfur carrier protein ThiS adenylyltransferase ThiF [Erysipelotrichaceae bacterium]